MKISRHVGLAKLEKVRGYECCTIWFKSYRHAEVKNASIYASRPSSVKIIKKEKNRTRTVIEKVN